MVDFWVTIFCASGSGTELYAKVSSMAFDGARNGFVLYIIDQNNLRNDTIIDQFLNFDLLHL